MFDFRYNIVNDPRTGAIANPTNPSNGYAATRAVPAFLCPSDGTNEEGRMNGRANTPSWVTGVTNYKGNAGSNWAWGVFIPPAAFNTPSNHGLDQGNGFFWRAGDVNKPPSATKLAKATDGLSNTFLVGEAIPAHCTHTGWSHFNYCTATAAIPLNVKAQCSGGQTGNKEADRVACKDNWENNYSFMSRHAGGGQFCMGDGSVKFVSDQIDLVVYRGAGSATGGETTQLP
jgi:prepilin-type processing-associated H-X9-DG protein